MIKLYPGDRVRLRSDLNLHTKYGPSPEHDDTYVSAWLSFPTVMESEIGNVLTVKEVHEIVTYCFRTEEYPTDWLCTGIIEGVVDETPAAEAIASGLECIWEEAV